VWTQA
jgi:hypothetical protein